jgi:hypothetical protein
MIKLKDSRSESNVNNEVEVKGVIAEENYMRRDVENNGTRLGVRKYQPRFNEPRLWRLGLDRPTFHH